MYPLQSNTHTHKKQYNILNFLVYNLNHGTRLFPIFVVRWYMQKIPDLLNMFYSYHEIQIFSTAVFVFLWVNRSTSFLHSILTCYICFRNKQQQQPAKLRRSKKRTRIIRECMKETCVEWSAKEWSYLEDG